MRLLATVKRRNDEAQFVIVAAKRELIFARYVEEGRHVEDFVGAMTTAARFGCSGDIGMGLAERIVHFIKDAAQFTFRPVSKPERNR